ncbi:MAG: lamin tail domain-containing protein, partial [Planctomycetota bacterium]
DSYFGDEENPGCNTPFGLSENGEAVYLTSGSGGELTGYSEVEKFGASETSVTFGRHVTSEGKIEFPLMSSSTYNSSNSSPKIGPIVISEIMYNPEDDGNAEYVELYNNSSSAVNLYDITGNPWKFSDEGRVEYYFDDDANIPGYSYAILVKDKADFDFEGYPAVPGGTQIFEWGEGELSNSSEKIILGKPGDLDNNGIRQYILVDEVEYSDSGSWPTQPDGFGQSLNRISLSQYANDPCNWQNGSPSPGDAFILAPADIETPFPNPAVWLYPPAPKSVDSIGMTASSGTDPSGVEYYFDETSGNPGGSDSGWQTSRSYTDTGLQENTSYTYRVHTRDLSPSQNTGLWSTSLSATTTFKITPTLWTTLTYDDFESGWGNYTDGGSACFLYTGGTFAYEGDNAGELRDNLGINSSFYYTNGIDVDTPGYTQIKIDFWFFAVSMETDEDFWVQYYDGTTWHTIADYDSNDEFLNENLYFEEITIDEGTYTFPSNMKIRFMCDASGTSDFIYIDQVRVTAK